MKSAFDNVLGGVLFTPSEEASSAIHDYPHKASEGSISTID